MRSIELVFIAIRLRGADVSKPQLPRKKAASFRDFLRYDLYERRLLTAVLSGLFFNFRRGIPVGTSTVVRPTTKGMLRSLLLIPANDGQYLAGDVA